MANYSSRFISGYATITAPLRELTRKENPWKWTERHNNALAQLKEALASAPVTFYFDPDKETEIVVDASPVGLGAILAQVDPKSNDRHTVSYASRSLTETEQRYSQTEREALAVVWACEHLHLYIYGKPLTAYTDHKPLIAIYGNPASQPPARIQRWALRLQPYQLTVRYRPGDGNPADYMSRHPLSRHRHTVDKRKLQKNLSTTSPPHQHPRRFNSKTSRMLQKTRPYTQCSNRCTTHKQLVQSSQKSRHQRIYIPSNGENEERVNSWTNIPRHPTGEAGS